MRILAIILTTLCFSFSVFSKEYSLENLNLKDGLPNSYVNCIAQDDYGYIWIGTSNGLCRYDGYTFEIIPLKNNTSGNEHITSIQFSSDNLLWIATLGGDLFCYDINLENFVDLNYQSPIENSEITTLELFNDTVLWVGTPLGLIQYTIIGGQTKNIKELQSKLFIPDPSFSNRNNNYITCLKIHKDDQSIWVGTNSKLYKFDINTFKFTRIYTGNKRSVRSIIQSTDNRLIVGFWNSGILLLDSAGNNLTSQKIDLLEKKVGKYRILSMLQENNNSFWIGTHQNGVFHFTFSNDLLQEKKFSFNPSNVESIGSNSVRSILKDKSDIIWLGQLNAGGLTKITTERYRLNTIKDVNHLNVSSILVRSSHKIWLGTQGNGLVFYDSQSQNMTSLKNSSESHINIGSNLIQNILEDTYGNFWVSTHGAGIIIIPRDKIASIENNQKTDGLNLKTINRVQFDFFNDYIVTTCNDSSGRFWIGTYQGLFFVDPDNNPIHGNFSQKGERKSIPVNFFENNRSLKKLTIHSLYIDKQGDLWICTKNKGLFKIDTQNPNPETIKTFEFNNESKHSLQSNKTYNCQQDDQNRLWVVSSKGLDVINLSDYSIKPVLSNKDIGNNEFLNLSFDKKENCWLGLSYGFLKFDTLKNDLKKYYRASTHGNFYNLNSIFQTENGTIYLGARNGITFFHPDSIDHPSADVPFYITSLRINNIKITPGEKINGRVILNRNINETQGITLKSSDHHITFNIASLDFLDRSTIQYKFLLEGAAPEWTTLRPGQHTLSFTNLKKGDYTLRIKATNSEGVWGNKEIMLKIKVLPHPLQSNAAIIFYSFLILILLYLFRGYSVMREKEKNKLNLIQLEKQKSEELNNMKLQFFTNISHEFRTPLSLIISPLEIILNKVKDSDTKQQLNTIQRNANRLLFLINQILDIRKLDAGKIKLSCEPVNLSNFSSEIYQLFQSLAHKKQIDFSIDKADEKVFVNIDKHYIESALYNILSNAFRFTDAWGKIEIKVYASGQSGCISVTDTGKGIPEEQIPQIFERFYHSPKQGAEWVGAGIGLSFSKSIVELHNGEIQVFSEEGKGSTFEIKLPLLESHVVLEKESATQPAHENILHGLEAVISEESELPSESTAMATENKKDFTILVAEDNSDLREFIVGQLKAKYEVLQAENGKIAWEVLQSKQPDLVITDLMMPEMDGLELCSLIKNSEDYSHIPVIMLTAKNLEEDRISGYKTGADAYIFKPFKFQFLSLRIENLLALKAKVKNQLKDNLYVTTDKKLESRDKIFIDKTIALVEENVNNSEFNVDTMYKSLGVSRTNLYRKIKELTGYSVKEFVREIRLQHAAQMFRENDITVNEVAFSVGFESTSYFSKCFKKRFNMSPNDYKNEHYIPPKIEM